MRIPTRLTRRAAKRGAVIAANTPDPARAVTETKWELGDKADHYRITIRRPATIGKLASVTVKHSRWPIGATAERKVTR